MDWFKSLLIFGATFYVAIAAFLYLFQERLIFYGAPVAPQHRYIFSGQVQDVWLENGAAQLHGVVFSTPRQTRGLVLFFKGNAGNIGDLEALAGIFLPLGFDVLAMDYRGSGKSRGTLSEASLMEDAELWFKWSAKAYDGKEVRLAAHSIGTTFACHVAAKYHTQHVMLLAPMKSGLDMANRLYPFLPSFLMRYPLRNDLSCKNVSGQIVIYHGTEDAVVPFASGAALKPLLTEDDIFIAVPGAGHNDLPWHPSVITDIAARWGNKAHQ